jgi:succinate dehydrogenase/fumarate reductase flavoprotein subunit
VSLRRRADGSQAVFPHFVMDRAKPGMLTVNQAGERFVNESTSYHLFGLAMQQAHRAARPSRPTWCATRVRQYGLGMVRPGGKGLAPFLADGYLVRGQSLEALARQLGLPPARSRAAWRSSTSMRRAASIPTSTVARRPTSTTSATPRRPEPQSGRRSARRRSTPCACTRATSAPAPAW